MISKTKQAFAMIEADPNLTLHAAAKAVGVCAQTLYTAKRRKLEAAARPVCPYCKSVVPSQLMLDDPSMRERQRIITGVRATRGRATDPTQIAVLDAMLRWLDKA